MSAMNAIPTYADGAPVREGDLIRRRQAPGGLLPRSESWRYGEAVRLPDGCERELYLQDDGDGRFYHIYGHEIERVAP